MSDSYIDPDLLKERLGDRIKIGRGCRISASTVIEIAEDAFLSIGDGVTSRRGVTLEVDRGATAVIGNNVHIGENVFIYVMCGLRVGSGVGISNMVDIHDHNHRERDRRYLATGELDPCDSGFTAAPIVIEDGAVISNKATLLAGVRVGANTVVGANAVVSRSLPPNTVAAGAPAKPFRSFQGDVCDQRGPQVVRVGFFGTSIMEHFEAYNASMFQQWNLPRVGDQVTVESWRRRGYAGRLADALRVKYPHLQWEFDNGSEGGANSRRILANVKAATAEAAGWDVVFTGCGINDVWRRFQGRMDEAVDIAEYEKNVTEIVTTLKRASRRVVFLGETPFDVLHGEFAAMNPEVLRYTRVARAVCDAHGVDFVDCYEPFERSVRLSAGVDDAARPGLWGDGVHLSDHGDELMLQILMTHAEAGALFTGLFEYERRERDEALIHYKSLTHRWRSESRPATARQDPPSPEAEPDNAPRAQTRVHTGAADAGLGAGGVLWARDLLPVLQRWRSAGEVIVWTNGCFDLLHDGHVRFLREARALGDRLVVGLNSDESVRRLKGEERPVVPFDQRAELLRELRSVDHVVALEGDLPVAEIKSLRPDICCKDETYLSLPLPERQVVEGYGGRMLLLPRHDGFSTTGLVSRIRKTEPEP
ncbi:adenylyltransferase/cytidyltransferase family protein [Streptomyces canus]|uniref:adenylyltransferase/cytidyltransferase family protein n=1 Tax=Streptomyces canus TaxID=58343 RepID=UPI0030DE9663